MQTETTPITTPISEVKLDKAYNRAAQLMVSGRTAPEVEMILVNEGLDGNTARVVVNTIEEQISAAKKSKAQKDMLYGALWCVGGLILTLAHIGFIFWGAIVFGGVQFFRGVANSQG